MTSVTITISALDDRELDTLAAAVRSPGRLRSRRRTGEISARALRKYRAGGGVIDVARRESGPVALALWSPPERPAPRRRRRLSRALLAGDVAVGGPVRGRYFGALLALARPRQPHWYLRIVDIDASAEEVAELVKHGLRRVDKHDRVYVETELPDPGWDPATCGFLPAGELPVSPGSRASRWWRP